MDLSASEIAAVVRGRLVGPDVTVSGASIDSRSVSPGQLFVPVVAERDGHDFIGAAVGAGAAAYLTSRDEPAVDEASAVVVADTVAALQAVARHARSRIDGPVIGVTGSVGKTSLKDLLAAVLSQRLVTAASERSFNNELGVPLTLLNAAEGTEAVVVEMGARGVGHIAALCAIAQPTIGIVTRIAAAHTELFGSIAEVARAKGELVEALPAAGTAVLNADDDRVAALAVRTQAAIVTYGDTGDVRAESVMLDERVRASFRLRSPWGDRDLTLGVSGVHQVGNALGAAAAALVCGLTLDEVAAGLAVGALSPWRMELSTTAAGALVLNDAYNANPTSMAAALESLAALPAERRTAVLGEMAELGAEGPAAHRTVADHARRLGIRVITVAAPSYGEEDVVSVADAVDLLAGLGEGDAVLVKGSRVAGLERVAEALLA